MTESTRQKISAGVKAHQKNFGSYWTGKKFSKESCEKKSKSLKGRVFSEETKLKMSISARGRWDGEKNPNWKGGTTKEILLARTSPEYKRWRTSVFKRDGFHCVLCGTKKGPFNADHIKAFSRYPELRFELSNGRTLCEPCHHKTDTYGTKSARKRDTIKT